MTEGEYIGDDEYRELLFKIVNYGIEIDSSHEAKQYIKGHLMTMKEEKAAGHPRGMAVWEGYMIILRQLNRQMETLQAREKYGKDSIWLPYTLR